MAVNSRLRYIPSPHHDARPTGVPVDLIVLHAISLPAGQFDMQYIEALFAGSLDTSAHPSFTSLEGMRVAAHFVVDREGSIAQFVPIEKRAWHAGQSIWQGREHCNDYSVGIEMIGDEQTPFTAKQYRETARLCRALMLRFADITDGRIVGHQDVAPGRKWDPGQQWDWEHFHRLLSHIKNTEMNIR